MIELKRISDEEIALAIAKEADAFYPYQLTSIQRFEIAAQAQLEDDQEKVKAIVQEIFEGIEGKLFNSDIYFSGGQKVLLSDWWQALKQKYGMEVNDG